MNVSFEDRPLETAYPGDLLDVPVRQVTIPYGDDELPGYLHLVDEGGEPRPTIIYTNGFDPSRGGVYCAIGKAALGRGYNFLTYDGPGQGSMIRERNVPLRPDWENVLGPVVDYALTVPEIDDDRMVQFGDGLGGYLVARYATRDDRSAAIVCHHAMTTFYAAYPAVPEPLLSLIEDGRDDEANQMLVVLMEEDADARRGLRTGQRAFAVNSAIDYIRSTVDYSLTAVDIGRIRTPVLLLEGDADTPFAGQAANFARAMKAPVRHVVMHAVDGAGRDRHDRSTVEVQQTVFSHLGATLAGRRSVA